MANELLLDTGALVSLLDRSQRRHREFVDFFDSWTGQVVTTEAVLTESTHLLGRIAGGAIACLDFVLSGGALLVPATANSIRRARDLMKRYADCPMDFADATLVVLAEDLGTNIVLTTDQRDFSIYRITGRKRFKISI
ncbi:MAG TPA: PIN domain-containing protein [Steroidobacteraceae bacterium]|nr:PIN domain-containing protein [Steroidobacteraceae bacterium]